MREFSPKGLVRRCIFALQHVYHNVLDICSLMHAAKTSDNFNLEQLKAIVLKGKGSTMIVEIFTSQHGEEAPNSCNRFETASLSVVFHPWIPQVPDSERVPDLDERWEEDGYVLHVRRTA